MNPINLEKIKYSSLHKKLTWVKTISINHKNFTYE